MIFIPGGIAGPIISISLGLPFLRWGGNMGPMDASLSEDELDSISSSNFFLRCGGSWGPDTLISLSFFFFDKPEIIFGN